MSGGVSPLQMIQGEEVLHRPARALIGWMSEPEAIAALLGRNPVPTDDLASLRKHHAAARAAVARLAVRQPQDPLISETGDRLDEIRSRPEVAASFPGMKWRPAIVDLRHVFREWEMPL